MRTLDLIILLGYLFAVVGYGCWFVVRSRTSEHFMSAGRALPGWAVGLSIFGSYVSSISFLAHPGKTYAENWNPFVFALSLPLATWIAVRWFVPFYRRAGEVSAYHHLEQRFGPWARTYAVVCYLLMQLARLGTILYLLALALRPVVGWDLWMLIVVIGVLVTIYPLLGGTEAVIWTGVVQAVVMAAGPVVCIVLLLTGMPEGPGQIFAIAAEHSKFSLGSWAPSFASSTVWVVLLYGLFTNLQNFGIDQTYVQRFITAKSDRDAERSVWMGGLLFIPINAMFLFIGVALFAFYQAQPALLPAGTRPDEVFPHFITHQLPVGITGFVLAALCSAAMDSNLNCCATLVLCDIYRRYLSPPRYTSANQTGVVIELIDGSEVERAAAEERESMRVLRATVLVMGALSVATSLAMIHVKSALDAWWKLAGIFSGGMLGLFLLGICLRRATGRGAAVGALAGVLVILWMSFSPKWQSLPPLLRSPFHDFMPIVIGTLTIIIVGAVASGGGGQRAESRG